MKNSYISLIRCTSDKLKFQLQLDLLVTVSELFIKSFRGPSAAVIKLFIYDYLRMLFFITCHKILKPEINRSSSGF